MNFLKSAQLFFERERGQVPVQGRERERVQGQVKDRAQVNRTIMQWWSQVRRRGFPHFP